MKNVCLSSSCINDELRYHLEMALKCAEINDKFGFISHFYGYRNVLSFLESYDWDFDEELCEMYDVCEHWFYLNIRIR